MSEREALWKEGFIEISNVKTELYGLKRRFGTTLLEWTLDVINTFNLKFWDCKKQSDDLYKFIVDQQHQEILSF